MTKVNPRKRPASQADVKRAWETGVNDGVTHAMSIILTVLVDKFNGAEYVKDVWREVQKLSEEVGEKRVSTTDLRRVLLDEYGIEIARSLVYQIEGNVIIETYDAKNHYHIVQVDKENGWEITVEKHGFSRCPLLHQRGKVAWEYAESTIEIWELMTNIQNIALKRFGTFALVFTGEMDKDSFKRDSSTLIINLSSDTTNGKQSADVLKFPEPQTMDAYLKTLEEKISLFSSTSFITPKDITATNSGGNGIALAMSNDYALATQSALSWRKFVNDMFYLHQEGLDIESNGTEKYGKLKVGAKIVPWSLETNNTKITNLQMEAKWLSMKTIIEKSPDAAPDEAERIISERGALVPQDAVTDAETEKAARISKNNSNEIVDNKAQTGLDN